MPKKGIFVQFLISVAMLFTFSVSANYEVKNILELEVSSSINPATESYIKNAINKHKDYDLLLINLNTPGGLVSTTKSLITLIGEKDKPTVIWVTPEGASATSAGAILSSAAHFVFMSPGTNMGAATPIQLNKDIDKKSDARKKAINDLSALVKSLSETRGRASKPIIKMITEASSISSQEALDQKAINEIISTKDDLLSFINGKEVTVQGKSLKLSVNSPNFIQVSMDVGQSLLNTFANPNTAYILFLIGAALLYLEFQAPGGFIAGSLGAVSLILSGIGFQVLPINMGALLLLVASFILFIIEAYITSYGILTIGGLASLIAGSLFLYRTDDSLFQIGADVMVSAVLAIVCFLAFLVWVIARDHKNIGKEKFNEHIGMNATVVSRKEVGDHYSYQIKINGEFWQATSKKEYQENELVKVISKKEHELVYEI